MSSPSDRPALGRLSMECSKRGRSLCGPGFRLATSLVLVALLAIATAASYSIEPNWRGQPVDLQQVPSYAAADADSPPLADSASSSPGSDELQGEDAELEQFLGKLVLARKLLDERLAREALQRRLKSEQQLAAPSLALDSLLEADNGPRYKFNEEPERELAREPQQVSTGSDLLARADRLAQELQLAKLAEEQRRRQQQQQQRQNELESAPTTNPLYYSVSHDEPASTDGEFMGHFGEPIVSRTDKRHAPKLTTLLEDEAQTDDGQKQSARQVVGAVERAEAANSSSTAGGTERPTETYGTVVEAGKPAERGKLSAFFQRLYQQLADLAPVWSKPQQAASSSSAEPGESLAGSVAGERRNSSASTETSSAQGETTTKASASPAEAARAPSKRLEPDEPSEPLELSHLGWQQQQQQPPAASLTRQPGLFVPMDESLLGKYIYAPTQHYYLGSSPAASGLEASLASQAPLAAAGQQQQQLFQPAYAFQKPELVLNGSQLHAQQDRANDLYFLIMVGAFCVMAMAVVLAAALFAYRVQQARKSSQSEQEYPTYGVVGPNSMNAKCGAAAFMGGYFVNQQQAGPKSGFMEAASSKFGSAKHLAELGSANSTRSPASGHASDSGLASLDKLSSAGKNCSPVASDQQQVVAAAAAAAAASVQQRQQASMMSCALASGQDAARMYHYQHQKQQMIVSDRSSAGRHTSASDLDSEDENDEGSYTVYECPGLASAHDMEIKNPLFNDERTP